VAHRGLLIALLRSYRTGDWLALPGNAGTYSLKEREGHTLTRKKKGPDIRCTRCTRCARHATRD